MAQTNCDVCNKVCDVHWIPSNTVSITWCEACISKYESWLKANGFTGDFSHIPAFCWTISSLVDVLLTFPHRYCNPPITLKSLDQDSEPVLPGILEPIAIEPTICPKRYYGTGKCICGGCKKSTLETYNRDAFGYRKNR